MVEISGHLYTEVKAVPEDASQPGAFKGILSTYGNLDLVGDICDAGCFDASIKSDGTRRPMLWQHREDEPIGSFDVVSTDKSLDIEGSFNLDTQRGREAYSLLKRGDVTGLSIGYMAEDYSYDDDGVRHLKQVKLLEGSLVTFPANPLAQAQAKSRRLKMSRYAKCAFLAKMSEEDRNAALAELDALDKEVPDEPVPEPEPERTEKVADPEAEGAEPKPEAPASDGGDEPTEDKEGEDVLAYIQELTAKVDAILAKLEA